MRAKCLNLPTLYSVLVESEERTRDRLGLHEIHLDFRGGERAQVPEINGGSQATIHYQDNRF